jgi:uncharacterized protein YaaW (UPF0174 family)
LEGLTLDELRTALELATEEELQQLTEILFRPKFNPLDYACTPDPITVQSQNRQQWLDDMEERFRFLAADGITVLRGRTHEVSYRQALIQVCRYLKIPYSNQLSTTDLESEVFLHLLGKTWKKLPAAEQNSLTLRVQRSLQATTLPKPLPVQLQHDPISLLLKGGSALAVTSLVRPLLLEHIARQFAIHFANYQVAKEAIARGSAAAAIKFHNYFTMQTARHGMALTTARYGAVRGVFAALGPAMWAWFFADLGWRSISTNYGRIIPIIFALAQIRLTRAEYSLAF